MVLNIWSLFWNEYFLLLSLCLFSYGYNRHLENMWRPGCKIVRSETDRCVRLLKCTDPNSDPTPPVFPDPDDDDDGDEEE